MKRLMVAVFASCLLCGCTKNYKTVDEYADAMSKVRASYPAFTIGIDMSTGKMNTKVKTYTKNDRWKADITVDGMPGKSSMLFDGKDLVNYTEGSDYALIMPLDDNDNNISKEDIKEAAMIMNPAYALINWNGKIDTSKLMSTIDNNNRDNVDEPNDDVMSNLKGTFVNVKDNKNGYDCRLIKFDNPMASREVCVSDKYGVAVWSSIKFGGVNLTYNLTNIAVDDIGDAALDVPNGVRKMTMESYLRKQEEKMKEFERKMMSEQRKLMEDSEENY